MTKAPYRLVIVLNLFRPQTGEKCIIQPTVWLTLWVQSSVSINRTLAFYAVRRLHLKSKDHRHYFVCVCVSVCMREGKATFFLLVIMHLFVCVCVSSVSPKVIRADSQTLLRKSISGTQLISAVTWQMKATGVASTEHRMKNGGKKKKCGPNIKKAQTGASTGNEILLAARWVINQLTRVVITVSLPASRLSNCHHHLSCIPKEQKNKTKSWAVKLWPWRSR